MSTWNQTKVFLDDLQKLEKDKSLDPAEKFKARILIMVREFLQTDGKDNEPLELWEYDKIVAKVYTGGCNL